MTLTIATWNVNSIAARLPLAARWLQTAQPDIVCLQEIKCIEAKFPAEALKALGYESLIFGQPTYNGVAILVRAELASSISEVQNGFPDDDDEAQRRLLAATINGVRVVNVYIPNGQAVGSDKYSFKLDWLSRLHAYFEANYDPAQLLALCGDFNVAPDPLDVHDPAQWEGKVLFSIPEREALQKMSEWGLTDSFRRLNPEASLFSWWDYRQAAYRRNLGLRIDHIWITENLMKLCQKVEIETEPRTWERPSDHTPVVATFAIV